MSITSFPRSGSGLSGSRQVVVAVSLALAILGLASPPVGISRAAENEFAPVRRPLPPNMVEAYAEGKVVALEYHQTFYCPTTPWSDLEPPFGHGDGHPQREDPSEYQVPPCFFGDTGTGSILPPELRRGAFPGVKSFYGMAPFFDTALGSANTPATDVETQCSEPGPPVTERRGDPGTCVMHPSVLRFARIFADPTRQPPDPAPLPQHSHLIPDGLAPAPAGWWNFRGVSIYDRSIWPDRDGNCPTGPSRCVTSEAALRAAQQAGQASIDVPSNIYVYVSIRPEER